MANISLNEVTDPLTALSAAVGQPARLQILLAMRSFEACVCHLEAALCLRQAAISQHLSILRQAGLVSARRDGRHIYYSLSRPEIDALLEAFLAAAGVEAGGLRALSGPVDGCTCPFCSPDLSAAQVCRPKPYPNSQKESSS